MNSGCYTAVMKTSRWKRYDKISGLWIKSGKPSYVYWYKYLQHAQNDPTRNVDWDKYDGWGGADTILNTKFDAWWKTHWKDLFGFELDKPEPRYSLSTTKPQPEAIRYSLMLYELKKEYPAEGYWEIAKEFVKKEYPKRRDEGKRDPNFQTEQWCFNVARAPVRRELMRTDKLKFAQQKRVLSSRMGRYLQSADKHLNNVCKGIFP